MFVSLYSCMCPALLVNSRPRKVFSLCSITVDFGLYVKMWMNSVQYDVTNKKQIQTLNCGLLCTILLALCILGPDI